MPDLARTLEQLEGDVWLSLESDTDLVKECHRLRRVPLQQLTVENLRIMIRQRIGLPHLIPLALERLEADPWVGGDRYSGDLLCAVVQVDSLFWLESPKLLERLDAIIGELQRRRGFLESEVLPAWQKIYGG